MPRIPGRYGRSWWLLALLGLLLPLQPFAQNGRSDALTARFWQTQNGLPEQTVQAFAQTPDGFLWIGTTGGLLRFDGSRFVAFNRENTPELREDSIFSLLAGRDGTLWIGTEGGGLLRLRGGVFRRFGPADGLTDGFVRTTLEDHTGRLWIGTDDGLFVLHDTNAAAFSRVDGSFIAPIAVHALAETAAGNIWVGGSRLLLLDGTQPGKEPRAYTLLGQGSETRVKSILESRDGTVWVGTVSGLQRLAPGAASLTRIAALHATVRTLQQAADGTLWVGTIGHGAFRLRDGQLRAIDTGPSGMVRLPSRTVLSLYQDADRHMWMGTQDGMLRFSQSQMGFISLPDAADSDFETIAGDRDGTLWSAGTKLSHLVDGAAVSTTFAELRGAHVRNVFRARDGALWVGTDGRGLFRLQAGEPPRQYTTASGLVNNFIRVIAEACNGDLWVGTDEGVSRISAGRVQNFTVASGLAYFSVRALLEDRDGDIWIGTDRGLTHLAGGAYQPNAATAALSLEKIWAIAQTADGALWFGTRNDGLYRYDPGTHALDHFTTERGLLSNSIYAILADRRQRLWMSGADGVQVLSLHDLGKGGTGAAAHLSQLFFAISEGAELSPLYGGTAPAAVLTADGRAWFPTSKGPVYFDTDANVSSAVPRVFIDQVQADGHNISSAGRPVVLPADNRGVEIGYGAILLGPQGATETQYRLDGFDREWRYGSNQRVAAYTNLPAGRYTFHVRAFESGSGQMTERELAIVKRQYFFLTWWFLAACAAALALGIWWLHEVRVRRVQAAFKAVLDERARLAREMHDTLIQGCAGVSLLLEACSAETADDNGQTDLLNYARTQLSSSIDEARQAVWNLREQNATDFGRILTRLTERIDRGSAIEVSCEIEGESRRFNDLASHEIAMASREAIYNALLHAHPTLIEVRAVFGASDFLLTVRDNGSGFEEHGPVREGHYGLVGLRERIQRIGGRVTISTAHASGTTVAIHVNSAKILFNKENR